ncbi:hypothetical protein DEF28_19075, partial [Marinitenerispora sediminis]
PRWRWAPGLGRPARAPIATAAPVAQPPPARPARAHRSSGGGDRGAGHLRPDTGVGEDHTPARSAGAAP